MNRVVGPVVLTSALISGAFAGTDAIYGEDNRREVFEATAAQQLLAKSTAAMVSQKNISELPNKSHIKQLAQRSLREWFEEALNGSSTTQGPKLMSNVDQDHAMAGISFCPGTKFVNQPNPAMCSGFLIAPDLIATAGHCVELENFCEEYRWVFDFKLDKATKRAGLSVADENIYKCKKVVSNSLNEMIGLDYALIQLDRAVTGRTPLKIRTDAQVLNAQELVIIGNPMGLPTKVADGAKVIKNNHPFFFKANLDSFQGNSGSAVFNSQTGVVEGILVRGEEDYVPNKELMCFAENICQGDKCRGEDVSRILSIPEVSLHEPLIKAVTTGNLELLDKVLEIDSWIDFRTVDGQSALIKASAVAQNAAMKKLIERGADVNLKDANGNTSLHVLSLILNETNADALLTLIDAKANLEERNAKTETALLAAATKLNLESAKILIKYGVDKNAITKSGENAIAPFAKKGNTQAIKALFDMGVEIESVLKIKTLDVNVRKFLKSLKRN